jgi:hypothetical protein
VSRAPSPQARIPYDSPAASSASQTAVAASAGTTSSYPCSPVYPVRQTTSDTGPPAGAISNPVAPRSAVVKLSSAVEKLM